MPRSHEYRTEVLHVGGSPMPVLIFEPEGAGPHPGLIIAQHLPVAHMGLEGDPWQMDTARRYAQAGYYCAMPYLFHWWPPETDIQRKRDEFTDVSAVKDLAATFELLAGAPAVDAQRIGIVGHCWGGRVSWLGACHERRLKACVVFYGGRIKLQFADGSPAPITLAGNIACPVQGIFGNDDASPSPADVDDYQRALDEAGVSNEFHRYDDAGHGFQDFHNPERYREAQSEDAWGKALDFLSRTLGPAAPARDVGLGQDRLSPAGGSP